MFPQLDHKNLSVESNQRNYDKYFESSGMEYSTLNLGKTEEATLTANLPYMPSVLLQVPLDLYPKPGSATVTWETWGRSPELTSAILQGRVQSWKEDIIP